MSIQVTANIDGTYTISCGAEVVIVGARSGQTTSRRQIDDNLGGVNAFIVIGSDASEAHQTKTIDFRSIDWTRLEEANPLGQKDSIPRPKIPGAACANLTSLLGPGQTIDVSALMEQAPKLGLNGPTPFVIDLMAKLK